MLLPWISQTIGLISEDPNSNILKDFPLAVRRVVVSSVVKYFAQQYDDAKKQLKTPSHLNWVMECIGNAFQLPIEDHEVINLAIDIYHNWLFNIDERPEPIKEDAQNYMQKIFRHFSFIFALREGQQKNVLKDHIFLCNRVLDIFLQMGVQGDMMDEDTWNHILKIILGISDMTLRGENGILELSYGLLKVLSELRLCSLSYEIQMWNELQKFFSQWTKHMATIKQWGTVLMALTLRVINLLYGSLEGTQIVRINWRGLTAANNPNANVGNPVTELDLPDEFVYFSWNMFIHILGNPNKIVNPEIHLKAFQAIQLVTRKLASIGSEPPAEKIKNLQTDVRLVYPPDGNTILDIFGPWYYEAVNRHLPVFNEGRSVAFGALCRIYCRKGGRNLSEKNLSLFYSALQYGLEEDDVIILSAILLNSCRIFSYELKGSHILIPYYIKVCEKILCSKSDKNYPEILRTEAITMIGSLICISNHYLGYEKKEKMEKSEEKDDSSLYLDIPFRLKSVLESSLLIEKSPKNLQQILWNICIMIYEHLDNGPKIPMSLINSIITLLSKHCAKPTKEYTPDVFVTTFEVLECLSVIYERVWEFDKDVGKTVVQSISLQLPILVSMMKNDVGLSGLICEGYYCMCDWIMRGADQILSDNDIIANIIQAVEIGLKCEDYTKQTGEKIEDVKEGAEFVLSHLMNYSGNFPPTNQSSEISTTCDEATQCFDLVSCEKSDYVKHFVFDDSIVVTTIEQPNEKGGPGCSLIVRTLSGKYMWDSNLLYFPLPKPEVDLLKFGSFIGSSSKGLTGFTKELETNQTIVQFSNPPPVKERKMVAEFESLIDEEAKIEGNYTDEIVEKNQKADFSEKPQQVKYKYDSDNKFQMSRLVLSHLGFLNIDLQGRFCQLQENSKLVRSLKLLDQGRERDAHKIGVVFVKEGQDTQQDILSNEGGSKRYFEFVKSLGWLEKLEDHLGFTGGLAAKINGSHAPYYADYKTEVIFHVATMMPTSTKELQQIHKKKHIGNDHVNIIWSENLRDYFTRTITSQFNFIHIVIYPLADGLFRVDIHVKEEKTPLFGPIVNGMILSEKILGSLVMQTAVNGNRLMRSGSTGYVRPTKARKKMIKEIAVRYKKKDDTAQYFINLFTKKEEEKKDEKLMKIKK